MPDPAVTQARIHVNAGRWSQARSILMRVLRREPRHPDACALMALALANEEQREQALHYAGLAAAASADPLAP